MELQLVLSFLWASILLALMPGPDNIFVLTESITKGERNGIAISIGLSSGVLVHTIAATTGLSLILQNSALAFQIVKYCGALYLFYLAIQSLKEKPQMNSVDQTAAVNDDYNFWNLVRKGFLMNVLNPKVSLFFIAFLPVFVTKSEHAISISMQMLILGFIFMLQSLIIFVMISKLSGKLSTVLNNSRFWKITQWGKAIVLGTLGVLLALSKK